MKYAAWVVLSAVFGWLVSLAIPNEYAAQAKIADEYKTTDLLIGLNSMNVMMRDLNSNSGNEGTDNIDIYSKILQSRDFIEGIGAPSGSTCSSVHPTNKNRRTSSTTSSGTI